MLPHFVNPDHPYDVEGHLLDCLIEHQTDDPAFGDPFTWSEWTDVVSFTTESDAPVVWPHRATPQDRFEAAILSRHADGLSDKSAAAGGWNEERGAVDFDSHYAPSADDWREYVEWSDKLETLRRLYEDDLIRDREEVMRRLHEQDVEIHALLSDRLFDFAELMARLCCAWRPRTRDRLAARIASIKTKLG